MPTPAEVLACPMDPARNDIGASTVKEYLVTMLADLWRRGSDFDGKRPYGNSGWKFDLYGDLGRAGLVDVEFDELGYIKSLDTAVADALVRDAIFSLL